MNLQSSIALALLALSPALRPIQAQSPVQPPTAHTAPTAAGYGSLPMSFEANQGQANANVKFLSRGNGYSLYLTDKSAVLSLQKSDELHPVSTQEPNKQHRQTTTAVVRMEVLNSHSTAEVQGTDRLPGTVNYFIGSDPSKWHANLPTYAKVKYADVYPGIDLIYYGKQKQLEYDFVVAPGADPKPIQLHITGASKLSLSSAGDLIVTTKSGDLQFHKPVVYQDIAGKHLPVDGSFSLLAKNTVGFKLGSYDANQSLVIDPTLTYSTYLGGSGQKLPAAPDCCGDFGNAIAVDAYGSAYVTGQTGSPDFPHTIGALQSTEKEKAGAAGTVFVTKLNSLGTAVEYSTYLGGSGDYYWGDSGAGIAVDNSGNAYITGYTGSSDFPTTSNAYLKTNKPNSILGYTGFITKLNPTGTALVYSTYLGGSGLAECCSPGQGDSVRGIALDASNNAYVVGTTFSPDYPTTSNAFQKVNNAKAIGQSNLFITKMNSTGTGLIYSTYLGGTGYAENCCYFFSGADTAAGIAIDIFGSAYVTGYAHSKDFPVTPNAYQSKNLAHNSINGTGAVDTNVTITKLSPDGSSLIYSTYLGGSGNPFHGDQASGIAVELNGQAYVTGQTGSVDFPTTSAYQPKAPVGVTQSDEVSPFVTCLSADGSSLVYSTYLDGSGEPYRNNIGDFATGIAVDANGDAYITGATESLDFPVTSDAFQPQNNEDIYRAADYFSYNAFITELDPTGSSLIYSSYFGGSGASDGAGGDQATAIALDSNGNAYITGHTVSSNLPTTIGAFQTQSPAYAASHGDSGNAFVAQFGIGSGAILIPTSTSISSDLNPAKVAASVAFTANVQSALAIVPATGSAVFSVDGKPGTAINLDGSGHATYATSTLAVGSHTIAVAYPGDSAHSASSASLTQVVSSDTTTITLTPSSTGLTYGEGLIVTASLSGSPAPTGTLSISLDGGGSNTATLNGSPIPIAIGTETVGTHTLTVTYKGDSNYGPATQSYTFTVGKATLTVTANSASRYIGLANPAFTYKYSGFQFGETSSNAGIMGSVALSTTATPSSPVGTYPITFSTEALTAANYNFTYIPGTLTVTSAGVTATPMISVPTGTYTTTQSVMLTDTTPGAVIYYTLDGTNPSNTSAKYTGAISASSSETLKAIAYAPDYTPSPIASATYTIGTGTMQCTYVNYSKGFTSEGLTFNGSAKPLNNLLQLTDGGQFERGSAFYSTRVPSTAFIIDFTFQLLNPNADGFTFVLQDNAPTALGGNGDGLGYSDIPVSTALKFDLHNNFGEGTSSTGIFFNGALPTVPSVDLLSKGIDLHSGHIFAAHITYDGAIANITIADTTTKASYTLTAPEKNMSGSPTSYVGFTGATGANTATQNILSWTYSTPGACPVN